MIIHSVIFRLKYPKDSLKEKDFLNASLKLSTIPGVHNLKAFRQISKKNNFDYGLSMEFETVQAYESYNQHPEHSAFIQKFWVHGVDDFLEIDYEPMEQQRTV